MKTDKGVFPINYLDGTFIFERNICCNDIF